MFTKTATDRVKSWLAVTVLVSACAAPDPVPPRTAMAPRQLGSWTGQGNTTLGFTSESGSFRVDWKTRALDSAAPGRFLLTLRSGISGRPLQVIADHEGAGSGAVDFGDDPRLYEFLVESNGVEWSIAVHETYAASRKK